MGELGAVQLGLPPSSRNDPLAGAGARGQHPVVANLMRTRRRNEGHQSIQQLVTRHQDVGRAIAPRGLETQGESSVSIQNSTSPSRAHWCAKRGSLRSSGIPTLAPGLPVCGARIGCVTRVRGVGSFG
jgi:hypothetical protein